MSITTLEDEMMDYTNLALTSSLNPTPIPILNYTFLYNKMCCFHYDVVTKRMWSFCVCKKWTPPGQNRHNRKIALIQRR